MAFLHRYWLLCDRYLWFVLFNYQATVVFYRENMEHNSANCFAKFKTRPVWPGALQGSLVWPNDSWFCNGLQTEKSDALEVQIQRTIKLLLSYWFNELTWWGLSCTWIRAVCAMEWLYLLHHTRTALTELKISKQVRAMCYSGWLLCRWGGFSVNGTTPV